MRCAVLGDPIAHSLSPALHRAAYAGLGLDWTYDALRVPAGGVAGLLDGLGGEWRGLSLTMPLKREVVGLLDEADPWVRLTGAANTVVLDAGRRLGANTDVTGARACLVTAGSTARTAVVLGGGATAASVLVALTELGLRRATVLVRDPARAAATVQAVARHPRAPRVDVDRLEPSVLTTAARRADIVVSTVPARAQTPDLVAAVAGVGLVFDVGYDPWPTPLAAAIEDADGAVISGLDLLVAQAVDQVAAMTGRSDAPQAAMRRAAEHELAVRAAR